MSNNTSLESQYPFLSIMHPAHLMYIRHLPLNTVDYFLATLDKLDPQLRYEIMYPAFTFVMRPTEIDPTTGSLKVLENSEATYESFKGLCRAASTMIEERLLVIALVHLTLSYIFNLGDTTAVDDVKDRLVNMTESSMKDSEFRDSPNYDSSVAWMVNQIEQLPEKTERSYAQYTYFCEHVLGSLLLE